MAPRDHGALASGPLTLASAQESVVSKPYTAFADLVAEAPVPTRGILSQTLSDEAGVELVMFSFAAGERLSEHTSARPAIMHVLSGQGELTVAGDTFPAVPGTWVRMAPDTRHALVAREPTVMALYLLPRPPK